MSLLSFLLNLCASDNVQCAAKTLAFQRESQQMRCPQGVSLSMTGRFYLRKLSRPSRFRLQRQHSPFPKRSLGERQAEYKKKDKNTSGLFFKKDNLPQFSGSRSIYYSGDHLLPDEHSLLFAFSLYKRKASFLSPVQPRSFSSVSDNRSSSRWNLCSTITFRNIQSRGGLALLLLRPQSVQEA